MQAQAAGWTVFLASLGMMATLLAPEISQLPNWAALFTPLFVGKTLAHFAVVVGAFIGGKIIPETRTRWTPAERAAKAPES